VQVIVFLIIQYSPASCHFLPSASCSQTEEYFKRTENVRRNCEDSKLNKMKVIEIQEYLEHFVTKWVAVTQR
jgi:hypothetical protein